MRFACELVPATLIRRYKRFLADVELADGSVVVAHVANPGAMTGLQAAGARVWLSSPQPYAQAALFLGNWSSRLRVCAGLPASTPCPQSIEAEALPARTIPELAGYATLRRK